MMNNFLKKWGLYRVSELNTKNISIFILLNGKRTQLPADINIIRDLVIYSQ